MRNFQEKKRFKNFIQSWPILIFLGILLIFFALGVFDFMGKMIETSGKKKNVEQKVLELQETKEKLSSDIESLKTERGLEENIREKFGLVKEGEDLIIVIDSKENPELDDKTKLNWFTSFFSDWFK